MFIKLNLRLRLSIGLKMFSHTTLVSTGSYLLVFSKCNRFGLALLYHRGTLTIRNSFDRISTAMKINSNIHINITLQEFIMNSMK